MDSTQEGSEGGASVPIASSVLLVVSLSTVCVCVSLSVGCVCVREGGRNSIHVEVRDLVLSAYHGS